MINTTQTLIVDESGDNVLPSGDEQSFYTINSLILNEDEVEEFRGIAGAIVKNFAGNGNLKSSAIGSDNVRRCNILKIITENKFPFYCLVIDKGRIWKDSGLKFKKIFYKYLHRMFFSRLKKTLLGMNVISDPYGSTEFMHGFIKYIEDNGNLFDSIRFVKSSEDPLIQISDIIAGSIRRVYLNQDPESNLELLGYPSIPIEEWPPNNVKYSDYKDELQDNYLNNIIRRVALNSVRELVENHIEDLDDDYRCLAEAARYLLIRYHQDPTQYVFKQEIVDYLAELGVRTTTREILSKLRSHDLIISSTEQGVKIPFDVKDITLWVERVNSQVVPYLKRFEKTRNDILIASQSKYDIVNKDKYPDLAHYIN